MEVLSFFILIFKVKHYDMFLRTQKILLRNIHIIFSPHFFWVLIFLLEVLDWEMMLNTSFSAIIFTSVI